MSAQLFTPEARAKRAAVMEANKQARADALSSEAEFLVMCGEGEAEIMRKLGYPAKPATLKRQLARIGRGDLIPRIFEHDQQINERLGR